MAEATERDIWFSIASDFYNYAISVGVSGLTAPNSGDSVVSLIRKVSIYTARIYNDRTL